MWWGAVGRRRLESRWRRRRPRYLWFGSSVALDRLGRVGHGDHKSAPRRHAGRRSYLHDRAARRSDLNHLAGLDAGRERDADLHFLCRLVSRARRRRRRSGREQVVRARRARAGRRTGFLARAVGSSGPGASQRAEALLQPLVEKRASLGASNSLSAPVWLVFVSAVPGKKLVCLLR